MKIAITGASGFVGKYVLKQLSMTSHEIIVLSRNPNDFILDFKNMRLVECDVNESNEDLFNIMGKPDHLIHLAWEGLPNYNSLFHIESVLPNQYKFLSSLVKQGLNSMFVSGTCFEYGQISGCLSPSLITQPVNAYGFAKDVLRKELFFLKQKFNFNLIWARIFYIYGDGQSSASIYTSLKDAISRGDKVFNMSGGEQLRDYLHVEKVAYQIIHKYLNKSSSKLVNICSGKPVSIRNLVEKWLFDNNWNIKLNLGYFPYPEYEPLAFWGEI